jgi:hypothetical protein
MVSFAIEDCGRIGAHAQSFLHSIVERARGAVTVHHSVTLRGRS